MRRNTMLVGALTLAFLGVLATSGAAASASLSKTIGFAAAATMNVVATACDNTGSTVEIDGTVTVGGLGVRLTFKNQTKNNNGTHSYTVVGKGSLEVTPNNQVVTIPKQPSRGGVGGNPYIFVRFLGGGDEEPVLVGRCVQGAKGTASKNLTLPGKASLLAQALGCDNRGSSIKLNTTGSRGGLDAEILFTNNKNKPGPHEWTEDATVRFRLLSSVVVPKQGNLNGPGGNPHIFASFVVNGKEGAEAYLGRCVQLR